jgi:hypothetical protein
MLLTVAAVFLPAAVAACFASRVVVRPGSLSFLFVVGTVILSRGATGLGVRRWISGWKLTRLWTVFAGAAVVVLLNIGGLLAGAADRVGGGKTSVTLLRGFLQGSVQEGDLAVVHGGSDLPGLVAWAVPEGMPLTVVGSEFPGVLLRKVASSARTWVFRRDMVERHGHLAEQVLVERITRIRVVDVGTDEDRAALGPGWGPNVVPPEPWSRALVRGKKGTLRVRLDRSLPNSVSVHLFTKRGPQRVSLGVNGVPCGTAEVPRGWSVVHLPAPEEAFRRSATNTIDIGFSLLHPAPVPGGKPWSAAVTLVVLERRADATALEL